MKSGMTKLAPGQGASLSMLHAYDDCVVLSQQEGYCGRRPKTAASPSPSPSKSPAASPSPSPSVAAEKSTPSSSVCVSQANDVITSCSSGYSSASSVCNTENNPSLQSAINAASSASLAVSQQTGGSLQAACSNMGTVGQVSSGALVAYRMSCQQAKDSCVSSCNTAKRNLDECVADAQFSFSSDFVGYTDKVQAQTDFRQKVEGDSTYKNVVSQLNQCNGMQTRIDQAALAVQNMTATAANAQNCAALTAAGMNNPTGTAAAVTSSDSLPTFCQQNPADPSCRGNSGSQAAQGITSQGGGVSNGTSTANNANGAALDLPPGSAQIPSGNPSGSAAADSEDPGGKKGAAVILGSDSLPAAAGKPANGASLNEGRYAYHGPGGFWGNSGSASGKSGSSSLGSSSFVSTYAARKEAEAATSPDLQKYLPGGQKDPVGGRGVAGGLVGPDGVTGPYTDLWLKVQNRYRVIEASLLP
jgi:hypothetical protein